MRNSAFRTPSTETYIAKHCNSYPYQCITNAYSADPIGLHTRCQAIRPLLPKRPLRNHQIPYTTVHMADTYFISESMRCCVPLPPLPLRPKLTPRLPNRVAPMPPVRGHSRQKEPGCRASDMYRIYFTSFESR